MRRALAPVLVLASLVPCAAAPAQEGGRIPELQGTFAGGWAGDREHLWLRGEADEAGTRLTLSGRIDTTCGPGTIEGDVPGTPDGAVDGSGVTVAGRVTTRWRLTGRFADEQGTGTVDAELEVRRTGRPVRRCATRGRPFAMAQGSSDHQLGPLPDPGSRWHGALKADGMQVAWVDPRRRRVRVLLLGADLGFCPNRTPSRLWLALRDVPIDGDGEIEVDRRLVLREGGLVRRLRLRVYGTFYSDGFGTTVYLREITRRRGRVVSKCETEVGDDAESLDTRAAAGQPAAAAQR